MKRPGWQVVLGLALVALSAAVYLIHYLVFRDLHHIFIYLVGDVAFVFVEVLLVTLIIHRLLSEREKRAKLEKLNMVIGTFFSQVGTHLLTYLSDADPQLENIRSELIVDGDWSEQEFSSADKRLRAHDYNIDVQKVSLPDLQSFLGEKRDFLVRLLENPLLLEHESFTELLRAVFHLAEELAARPTLADLPDTDYRHLVGDLKRIYGLLVDQWLDYMWHLRNSFPYLYSLAMRTNPFDQEASPLVR